MHFYTVLYARGLRLLIFRLYYMPGALRLYVFLHRIICQGGSDCMHFYTVLYARGGSDCVHFYTILYARGAHIILTSTLYYMPGGSDYMYFHTVSYVRGGSDYMHFYTVLYARLLLVD